MKIIYATTNKGKIEQVENFIKYHHYDIQIISLKDIGFSEEIEEDGDTFEKNSMIKAKAVNKYCKENNINGIIVADDGGLVVEALGGRPGVHSARYAGDHVPQEVAINKLLDEMKGVKEENRTARFECVLTAILENGKIIVTKGETKGKIAMEKGTMGKLTFGPVLIPDGYNKVMNDLTEEEIGHTHRQKAWRELLKKIGDKV